MRRSLAFAIGTFLILLVAGAAVISGCGENAPASLDYDKSPDNVLVEYWAGGGLPAPWDDSISEFRLFGDGTVIRNDPTAKHLFLLKGWIGDDDVGKLLEEIKEAGFFGLKDEYINESVMDGVSQIITVNLKDEKKKVKVYMTDVREFDATRKLLIDYPMNEAMADYEPEKGYLVVQKSRGGQKAALEPSNELYGLLPGAAALKEAADTRKPIEIDGASLAKLKRFESQQQYVGFIVQADGVAYEIYPVYEPR